MKKNYLFDIDTAAKELAKALDAVENASDSEWPELADQAIDLHDRFELLSNARNN